MEIFWSSTEGFYAFCHYLYCLFNLKHHQRRSFHFEIDVIILKNSRRCLFQNLIYSVAGLESKTVRDTLGSVFYRPLLPNQ